MCMFYVCVCFCVCVCVCFMCVYVFVYVYVYVLCVCMCMCMCMCVRSLMLKCLVLLGCDTAGGHARYVSLILRVVCVCFYSCMCVLVRLCVCVCRRVFHLEYSVISPILNHEQLHLFPSLMCVSGCMCRIGQNRI